MVKRIHLLIFVCLFLSFGSASFSADFFYFPATPTITSPFTGGESAETVARRNIAAKEEEKSTSTAPVIDPKIKIVQDNQRLLNLWCKYAGKTGDPFIALEPTSLTHKEKIALESWKKQIQQGEIDMVTTLLTSNDRKALPIALQKALDDFCSNSKVELQKTEESSSVNLQKHTSPDSLESNQAPATTDIYEASEEDTTTSSSSFFNALSSSSILAPPDLHTSEQHTQTNSVLSSSSSSSSADTQLVEPSDKKELIDPHYYPRRAQEIMEKLATRHFIKQAFLDQIYYAETISQLLNKTDNNDFLQSHLCIGPDWQKDALDTRFPEKHALSQEEVDLIVGNKVDIRQAFKNRLRGIGYDEKPLPVITRSWGKRHTLQAIAQKQILITLLSNVWDTTKDIKHNQDNVMSNFFCLPHTQHSKDNLAAVGFSKALLKKIFDEDFNDCLEPFITINHEEIARFAQLRQKFKPQSRFAHGDGIFADTVKTKDTKTLGLVMNLQNALQDKIIELIKQNSHITTGITDVSMWEWAIQLHIDLPTVCFSVLGETYKDPGMIFQVAGEIGNSKWSDFFDEAHKATLQALILHLALQKSVLSSASSQSQQNQQTPLPVPYALFSRTNMVLALCIAAAWYVWQTQDQNSDGTCIDELSEHNESNGIYEQHDMQM